MGRSKFLSTSPWIRCNAFPCKCRAPPLYANFGLGLVMEFATSTFLRGDFVRGLIYTDDSGETLWLHRRDENQTGLTVVPISSEVTLLRSCVTLERFQKQTLLDNFETYSLQRIKLLRKGLSLHLHPFSKPRHNDVSSCADYYLSCMPLLECGSMGEPVSFPDNRNIFQSCSAN